MLTRGVGCDAAGTWPGVPGHPFGVSGTLHTSFGAVCGNHGRQHITYKLQKLFATPRQSTRVIKKPRGSIGFEPNVW